MRAKYFIMDSSWSYRFTALIHTRLVSFKMPSKMTSYTTTLFKYYIEKNIIKVVNINIIPP